MRRLWVGSYVFFLGYTITRLGGAAEGELWECLPISEMAGEEVVSDLCQWGT